MIVKQDAVYVQKNYLEHCGCRYDVNDIIYVRYSEDGKNVLSTKGRIAEISESGCMVIDSSLRFKCHADVVYFSTIIAITRVIYDD